MRWSALLNKDALSGLLFIMIASIALYFTSSYRLGSAARMGPGYFPSAVAVCLIVVGLIIAIRGVLSHRPVRPVEAPVARPTGWQIARPLVVLLATLLFGLAVPRLGLVLTIPLTVGVIAIAQGGVPKWELLAQLIAITAFMIIVFIEFLGIPLRVWPV
jgi:hypothetical protein